MSQEEEHGAAPSPPQGFAFPDLVDEQLLREITLLIDVISEVSDSRQHLTTDEVDSVLGVRPRAPLRDLHIAVAVHLATRSGLKRTSNRARKAGSDLPPSACAVVAEELLRLGAKGVTEAAVEQISTRFRSRAAPYFLPD